MEFKATLYAEVILSGDCSTAVAHCRQVVPSKFPNSILFTVKSLKDAKNMQLKKSDFRSDPKHGFRNSI